MKNKKTAFQFLCHFIVFHFHSLWSESRVAGWWIEEVGEAGFPDSAPSSALGIITASVVAQPTTKC
jgi:hypothetical protein